MNNILALFIAVLVGCAFVSPRTSLQERQRQRFQEFETESKTGDVLIAVWKLKENIKKDYGEIIGPSKAFDEKMELQFSNLLNESMLATPGQYEKMAESWAKTKSDPVPTREKVQKAINTLDVRIKTLDGVIAQEMQLAEE